MSNEELYHNPTSIETENIIKSNTDMSISNYVTISGIMGRQFNKDIYSAVLKFKDLQDFLTVFSEVQRNVSNRKVLSIKNYILSSLEDESLMRFFSALTVTARGHIFYDENTNKIAIDTNKSRLSINDGQHRYYGAIAALEECGKKMRKAKEITSYNTWKNRLETLENMVMPLVIFSRINEKEEKQLFHDINNLAQRPSRNSNIRLSQTDLISKLSLDIGTSNEYLNKYGVEMNKNSIHKKNPNFILLSTIYAFIKNLYLDELRNDTNFINSDNYNEIKNDVSTYFTEIFKELPNDLNTKGKYVLEKNYAFRGISVFLNSEVKEHGMQKCIAAIGKVTWESNIDYWGKYGAILTETGLLLFSNNGERGVQAVRAACYDELMKIK